MNTAVASHRDDLRCDHFNGSRSSRRQVKYSILYKVRGLKRRDVCFGSLADKRADQGCPLYPQKRTCSSSASMSAMCQKQTSGIRGRQRLAGGSRLLAVLHEMTNDCSQHLWSFPCDVLE